MTSLPRSGPPTVAASRGAGSLCGPARSPRRWPSTPCTPTTPPVRRPAWPPRTASRTTSRPPSRPRHGSCPESPPPDPSAGGGQPARPRPFSRPVQLCLSLRKEAPMNRHPDPPRLKISSLQGLLAVIPHLLGFTPEASLVVLGVTTSGGRVQRTFRYDLPDPPDAAAAAEIAAHAASILSRQHMPVAIVVGYGPGPLVTPVADAIRAAAYRAGLELRDVLRVHEGRY